MNRAVLVYKATVLFRPVMLRFCNVDIRGFTYRGLIQNKGSVQMKKFLSLILLVVLLATSIVTSQAKGMVTSIGLAEHGLKAYNDHWQYQYGGKGQVVNGHRVSDCAGLIYAYFSDNGISGCYGGCTGQVSNNCVFSSKLQGKIPNIHGLAVTMYDTVAPETGIYGHIGIYIGAGLVCDNSTYGTNMVKANVFSRNWTEWHLFDLGVQYPVNGWYAFDNKMVYYQDYEYLTNVEVDGYYLNESGFALDSNGNYASISDSILSWEYASAEEVKRGLMYKGWKNNGGSVEEFESNATVIGNSVRLRSEANTNCSTLAYLNKNTPVNILEEVVGETISSDGNTSSIWYKIQTQYGKVGYMCSLFVLRDGNHRSLSSPEFSYIEGEGVKIKSPELVDILYTTDCTSPQKGNGIKYEGPVKELGCTYTAVCKEGTLYSPISTFTITSTSQVFTDFNYSNWFAPMVDEAVAAGLFVGTGHNTFSPTSSITRGQFVLVLARMANADLSKYDGMTKFKDVDVDSYYAKAVDWAEDNEIVAGIGYNRFAPGNSITREQVCTIIQRYLNWGAIEDNVKFDDDNHIATWAKDAVYACRANGVISGVGNNRFNPKGKLTRAEGATIAVNSHKFF